MSLNFSDTGKPVAKIKGGKYNGKRISLNPDMHDRDRTDFRRLRIANDAKLQHIPDTTKERETIYITGRAAAARAPIPVCSWRSTRRSIGAGRSTCFPV